MFVGTFKNTSWSDSLVPFSIRKSCWNEFLKCQWWIEDPKKLFYALLWGFSVLWLVVFFPQHNVIEGSQALIRCSAGLVAGGDWLFAYAFFFILQRWFQNRNVSPCSQYVGTGGCKRRGRGKETETSRKYMPFGLFQVLAAFVLKAYKNKSWMLNGGRKWNFPTPIWHSRC